MDPHGMRLWLYFIAAWVMFWGVAGGAVCRSLGKPMWKGIVFGAILAPIGILLAILTHEEPDAAVPKEPTKLEA